MERVFLISVGGRRGEKRGSSSYQGWERGSFCIQGDSSQISTGIVPGTYLVC